MRVVGEGGLDWDGDSLALSTGGEVVVRLGKGSQEK